MYKQINKNIDYFSADTHYFHANILKYCNRPFKDLDEMHHILIENHNKIVSKTDVIAYVGDMFLCDPQMAQTVLQQLNGYKILFLGNHDRASIKTFKEIGFNEVFKKAADWHYQGINFRLAHYPFGANRKRSPVRENCDWLICGHVHNTWLTLENMINVGVDIWDYKPVGLEQILTLIKGIHHE